MKQYCNEVKPNLSLASDEGQTLRYANQIWVSANNLVVYGGLIASFGNDALTAAKKLPAWSPAKKVNTLLVKAAKEYADAGAGYESAGRANNHSAYTSTLVSDHSVIADGDASIAVGDLMSAWGIGC